MKYLFTFILILFSPALIQAGLPQSDEFFAKADQFFQKHVENGRIDYANIKKNPAELMALTSQIAETNLESKSASYIKAFLTNAYNILIIKQVIENYPVQGPMAINGFFDKTKYKVAGNDLTLNQLEKGWLYQEFPDPRLHFALVCAAVGCPPIAGFAFQPEQLNQQLNEVTTMALNDEEFVRVDEGKKKVLLSQIFNWYKKDFLKEADSLLEFVNQYRKKPFGKDYKTGYYEYDWSLNDVRNSGS